MIFRLLSSIEKIQEKIDSDDEEEEIFGIVNKWWLIEMKRQGAP